MAKTKAKSTLSEINSKMREDARRFDEVLRELVESGEPPSFEVLMFASQLGIDPPAFKAQHRRMSRVLSFQQVAGTSEDRTELEQAAVDAEKLLATDGEKLLAQIAELQTRYSAMESKAKQLRRRHSEATKAVEELKQLVPDVVKQEYSLRKRLVKESLGREIKDRETRVAELEIILNDRDRFDQGWLDAVRRCDHSFVAYDGDRGHVKKVLLPTYEAAKPKLQAELNEIRSELEPMRKQFDLEMEAAVKSLEVYAR